MHYDLMPWWVCIDLFRRSVIGTEAWFDRELTDCTFGDKRLAVRLRRLIEQMDGAMGSRIPLACQDWANTKAAYRFFAKERVGEADIIAGHFRSIEVQGVHRVEIRDDQGGVGAADVELRFRRVRVLPPIGKQKRYPALSLTVIHARERDAPADRPAIDWKLITDLPVTTCAEAVE